MAERIFRYEGTHGSLEAKFDRDKSGDTISFSDENNAGIKIPAQFMAYVLQEFGPLIFPINPSDWRGQHGIAG